MKQLLTERLILRSPKETDVDDIYIVYNQDFVMKNNVMNKKNRDEIIDMLEKDKHSNTWYMEEKNTKKVIGIINKRSDSLRFETNTCELSYWLGEQHSNKGYMTEALREVIDYLFKEENISGITCRVFEDNVYSAALLRKLGFAQEGRLENAVKSTDGVIYNDLLFYLVNK
ncbi:GNAT family N-acetyltransferase [Helcococcus kunzii]